MYDAPPRQQISRSPCQLVRRRTKRECPSSSNRYNKLRTLMSPPLKLRLKNVFLWKFQQQKTEESQLIMDLFPAIGKAIQQLQGTECSEHLQTVNALKMMPTLLKYGPIANIINFLHFYQTHHTMDEIPKPTIRTRDAEYATVEERTKAMQHHTTSLQ